MRILQVFVQMMKESNVKVSEETFCVKNSHLFLCDFYHLSFGYSVMWTHLHFCVKVAIDMDRKSLKTINV
jgi:hypothetical protein